MSPLGALAIFAVGLIASVFGTLVGMGGGFVVIPILRIAFGAPPAHAAGTSLVMVLANTITATFGYLRHRLVDVPLAIPLMIGAVPGSILGVFAVRRLTPSGFDLAYGIVLVSLSVLVVRRRMIASRPDDERTFAHDPRVALGAGVGVGFFSSMFGIGAGVVLIPLLLLAARMRPHTVAATSALVVTATAPVGVATHALAGDVDWGFAAPLVAGGLAGGAIGPLIARRVSSPALITLLAAALIVAAISLAVRHLF